MRNGFLAFGLIFIHGLRWVMAWGAWWDHRVWVAEGAAVLVLDVGFLVVD